MPASIRAKAVTAVEVARAGTKITGPLERGDPHIVRVGGLATVAAAALAIRRAGDIDAFATSAVGTSGPASIIFTVIASSIVVATAPIASAVSNTLHFRSTTSRGTSPCLLQLSPYISATITIIVVGTTKTAAGSRPSRTTAAHAAVDRTIATIFRWIVTGPIAAAGPTTILGRQPHAIRPAAGRRGIRARARLRAIATGTRPPVAPPPIDFAASAIRDANIAEEAAALTKFNILTQSGLAALAQANQGSSAVLSLLR